MNGNVKEAGKYGIGSVGGIIIMVLYHLLAAKPAPPVVPKVIERDIASIKTELIEIKEVLKCLPKLTFRQDELWEEYKKRLKAKNE